MINAILMSATRDPQILERSAEWVFGTARATVQAPNKLGYGDRLTLVDSRMAWSQLLEADGSTTIPVVGRRSDVSLRYPVLNMNLLRSLDRVYHDGEDFRIQDDGSVLWLASSAPASGTILTAHYMVHPVYRVMDHFFAFRDTYQKRKHRARDKAPQFTELPSAATVKLDFLLDGQIGLYG